MNSPLSSTRGSLYHWVAGLCLALLWVVRADALVIDPGPILSVSPGTAPNGFSQPGLFTWNGTVHVSGTGFAPGESVAVVMHGPLNTLGAVPSDRNLGSITAGSGGNLGGDLIIPYDGGVTGNAGQNLPNIPRPGFYQVVGTGTTTGPIIAQDGMNLCPATKSGDLGSGPSWGVARGGRTGFMGDTSPERVDPEWLSVWNETPIGLYATVAETDGNGGNQPAFISHEDWPGYHYSHDVDILLQPDPEYLWVLSTANFDDAPGEVGQGRLEWEWEAQSHGNDGSSAGAIYYGYGGPTAPNRGLPLWAMPAAGDRVYTVGRWALDNGHPDHGDRTEMHPPRLLATMRKRDTVAPLFGDCMTRARQVDLYVSGHGGGANQFPDALFQKLNFNLPPGAGGGRIQDQLTPAEQDVYYAYGPIADTAAELDVFFAALCTFGTAVNPILGAYCAVQGFDFLGQIQDQAGPTAFGWNPGPEERPINDMNYEFDVRLPDAPARATGVRVQVTTHPEHTTAVAETITYTNPDPATGLPTTAHIQLPYQGADSAVYARTLKFYWDTYNPPGRHFVVQMNDIHINNDGDFDPFDRGGSLDVITGE